MTRAEDYFEWGKAEHLEWCKRRAREYLARGDALQAFASMVSDLQKHAETKCDPAAVATIMAAGKGNEAAVRSFIDGF